MSRRSVPARRSTRTTGSASGIWGLVLPRRTSVSLVQSRRPVRTRTLAALQRPSLPRRLLLRRRPPSSNWGRIIRRGVGLRRHVDELVAAVTDRGPGAPPGEAPARRRARTRHARRRRRCRRSRPVELVLLLLDPLLDPARLDDDHLLLTWVLVEVVSAARTDRHVENGNLLRAGNGRRAPPADLAPVELVDRDVAREDKSAHLIPPSSGWFLGGS